MERRTVLKILGTGAIAAPFHVFAAAANCHEHMAALAQLNSQSSQYALQFFTPEEHELVDQLTELIIPADAYSPGAHAAKVGLFADLMLANGAERAKQQWRNGLRMVKQDSALSSVAEVLEKAAVNEADPKTELEHFFAALKEMT